MKTCKGCGLEKPANAYDDSAYIRKDGTRTPHAKCRECRRVAATQYRRDNPERARDRQIRSTYGITAAEYNDRADSQHGLCGICLANVPLQLDHDHSDGRLRGMLCGPCNRLLGQAADRADILRRAADYLDEYAYCKESV